MTDDTPKSPAKPADLRPVLALVFLCSLGTGAITTGVFFIARERFEFSATHNLALALVMSMVYIPAAWWSGPIVRALRARFFKTTQRVLLTMLIGMSALCALPPLAPSPLALWIFALCYMPLTGLFWPVIESYLSGGRTGQPLRRAGGLFNVSWSVAIPIAYWLMSPFMERAPLATLVGLAFVHGFCVPVALRLTHEPARHLIDTGDDHLTLDERAIYTRLLAGARRLLLASYVLMSALAPMAPTVLERVGLEHGEKTAAWSVVHVSRVVTFALLAAFSFWHGKAWPLALGAAAMLFGFVGTLTAPSVALIVPVLALLGVGLGAAYAASFYYAMEVGGAEVDAGGKHEAIIGMGYAVGPLIALIAAATPVLAEHASTGVAILVGCAACVLFADAVRAARPGPPAHEKTPDLH
ncbi:MAG: hypothetical protein AAGD00_11190 [Planctomycetota bacterium]